MVMVNFIFKLGPSHTNLLGIADHNIIARIYMWRVLRLVLTTKSLGYLGRKTT